MAEPLMLDAAHAAAYLGMSRSTLEKERRIALWAARWLRLGLLRCIGEDAAEYPACEHCTVEGAGPYAVYRYHRRTRYRCARCQARLVREARAGRWERRRDARARRHRRPARHTRPAFTAAERIAVITRDQHTCCYCLRRSDTLWEDPDGAAWHIDHIIPLSKGGPHESGNWTLSCRRCNLAKGATLGVLPRFYVFAHMRAYLATKRSYYESHVEGVRV